MTPATPHLYSHYCPQPDCNSPVDGDSLACAHCDTKRPNSGWPPDPLTERIIDQRFRVRGILGSGGFAYVYLVSEDLGLGETLRLVRAMKVLSIDKSQIPSLRGMFLREARALCAIQGSPYAPRFVAFGELHTGQPYFVQEYIHGRSLRAILEAECFLDEDRALGLAGSIAAALADAFSNPEQIIHRDLKPENVMVVRDSTGTEYVRLLDYGIARFAGPDATHSIPKNYLIGTPRYMAPEHRKNHAEHRSDLYSLGIILHEMLIGHVPAPGQSMRAEAQVLDRPVSEETIRLTNDLINPDMKMRPNHANAVVQRIAHIRKTRIGTSQEPSTPAKRSRKLFLILSMCIVALSAALVGTWYTQNERSEKNEGVTEGMAADDAPERKPQESKAELHREHMEPVSNLLEKCLRNHEPSCLAYIEHAQGDIDPKAGITLCKLRPAQHCVAQAQNYNKADKAGEALHLFQLGCESSVQEACIELRKQCDHTRLEFKRGTHILERECPKSLKAACNAKDAPSCELAGILSVQHAEYHDGLSYFATGCKLGEPTACQKEIDLRAAQRWLGADLECSFGYWPKCAARILVAHEGDYLLRFGTPKRPEVGKCSIRFSIDGSYQIYDCDIDGVTTLEPKRSTVKCGRGTVDNTYGILMKDLGGWEQSYCFSLILPEASATENDIQGMELEF